MTKKNTGPTIRYKVYCPRCGSPLSLDRPIESSKVIINEPVRCQNCRIDWLISLHGRRIFFELAQPTLDLFLKSIDIETEISNDLKFDIKAKMTDYPNQIWGEGRE